MENVFKSKHAYTHSGACAQIKTQGMYLDLLLQARIRTIALSLSLSFSPSFDMLLQDGSQSREKANPDFLVGCMLIPVSFSFSFLIGRMRKREREREQLVREGIRRI